MVQCYARPVVAHISPKRKTVGPLSPGAPLPIMARSNPISVSSNIITPSYLNSISRYFPSMLGWILVPSMVTDASIFTDEFRVKYIRIYLNISNCISYFFLYFFALLRIYMSLYIFSLFDLSWISYIISSINSRSIARYWDAIFNRFIL